MKMTEEIQELQMDNIHSFYMAKGFDSCPTCGLDLTFEEKS